MSTALVPCYPGRPTWLRVGSVWVCVSCRDAGYLRERAEWKRRLFRQGQPGRKMLAKYARWRRASDAWYTEIGLDPPPLTLTATVYTPPRSRRMLLAIKRMKNRQQRAAERTR